MRIQAPAQPTISLTAPLAIPVPKSERRIEWRFVFVGVVVLAALSLAIARWARPDRGLPEGLLQANGRIEGDPVTIASKFPGRVGLLAAREGKMVRQGELIAALDAAQADARVSQKDADVAEANGASAQATAGLTQAKAAVSATEARIRAAQTALTVSQHEVFIRIRKAETGLAHARSALTQAESAELQARRDMVRFQRLSERGDVEARRSEQAELALVVARSDLTAAKSQVIQAEQELEDAQLGPQRIRAKEEELRALEAQISVDRASIGQAEAALTQALANVRHAEAVHREALSDRTDLTISAPIDGIVMTRMTDEGEVVAAGSPLLTLVDLDRLYLRVFVPEAQIGKIRLGLSARVYTDAFSGKYFSATVRYISSRAEFTPREVQTPEERVKLVYAVKLYLDVNPDYRLTPGLPADAVIRWRDDVPWREPRW